MQQVLVTGGTGFIGRHLVSELTRRGVHVRCLVRRTSDVRHLEAAGVETVYGEVLNLDEMRRVVSGVDSVFHLAGLTHAMRRTELHAVNGRACSVLADACRSRETPPRLVYVSSLSAAGPTSRELPPLTEVELREPVSHYGASKRRGEIEIQKRAADVPCTVVRPGFVYGPFDPGTLSILQPIYEFRLHLVVGFHTPPLSMIFVDDLVQLLLQAAAKGERLEGNRHGAYAPAGYYFACDDSEHPTYCQLGQKIAGALDQRVFICPIWHWVGWTIAGTSQLANRMQGKSSLLNVDKIREATAPSWACSAEKARRQLDFHPLHDLDSRLKQTAEWFLHHQPKSRGL